MSDTKKRIGELELRVAELEQAASRDWYWTDENLPGISGRLLICVGGSVREGYYHGDGKFTDKYGEQSPKAWKSLPWAPMYRNGQYVSH